MCESHFSILKYMGVHGFVDLPNRKCDIGRFSLDSVLGPPNKILLILPHTPWKFWPLDPPPCPGISSDPPMGGGGVGYGYFLEPHIFPEHPLPIWGWEDLIT